MDALSQLKYGIDWSSMGSMLLRIAAILLCLVVHELCHGLAAYYLGDPTAKQNHRLSLNPLRHLDIFGLLMMVTVGFGWAKPVPVDPRYFKNPKRGMAVTALAGPLSNFALAFVSALVCSGLMAGIAVKGQTGGRMAALNFFYLLLVLNIGLGVFNLIPFPPLDGSKVVAMFLPDGAYIRWMRLERYGMLALMAILWLGWIDAPLYAVRTGLTDWMLARAGFVYGGVLKLLLG